MKLYLIDGTYCGTQAEAKAEAKRVGIKFDATTHEANVPTDKEGLIAYLNGLSRGVYGATPATVPAPTDSVTFMTADGVNEDRNPTMSLEQALAVQRAAVAPDRVAHSINVEEEIGRADARTAQRLMEHCVSRLVEHIEGRA